MATRRCQPGTSSLDIDQWIALKMCILNVHQLRRPQHTRNLERHIFYFNTFQWNRPWIAATFCGVSWSKRWVIGSHFVPVRGVKSVKFIYLWMCVKEPNSSSPFLLERCTFAQLSWSGAAVQRAHFTLEGALNLSTFLIRTKPIPKLVYLGLLCAQISAGVDVGKPNQTCLKTRRQFCGFDFLDVSSTIIIFTVTCFMCIRLIALTLFCLFYQVLF